MKLVDLETWNRKAAYEFFKDYEDPFFNLTAPLDATALYRFCKTHDLSFALACLYCSLAAANCIREFRIRLKDDKIVEYNEIHATQTVLHDDETFSFCYFERRPSIFEFCAEGRRAIDEYKRLKTFDVAAARVDLIYYSVIPWISFTSFKHATRADNRQSVPRMVFGKMTTEESGRRSLPHSVEVHHALVDGFHVGRYFARLQEKMDDP